MLRLWLPQRQLLHHHHLHPRNFLWQPRGAASFLHRLRTSAFCTDRRRRVAAASISSDSISTLQKKSKGQKKREAHRAVDWAAEIAAFSDSQLRRAIRSLLRISSIQAWCGCDRCWSPRWGSLKEEVYDAVRVVKKIGRDGRHARTRQLKLIGGMLRAVDPELMEAVIKAIKDGDVEGVFKKPGELNDEDDDNNDKENDEKAEEDDDNEFDSEDDQQLSLSSEEDDDNMDQDEDTVERWFQGLLSGDSDVVAEVYSIRSASFNRQELRRLVRDASKSQSKGSKLEDDSPQAVLEKPASSTKILDPQAKLRDYLENLAVKIQDDD